MDEEGLFIPLQVNLDALKQSFEAAGGLIDDSIKKISDDFKKIGDTGGKPAEPLEKTNEKLKESAALADKFAKQFEKFFGIDANAILGKFGLSIDKVVKMFTSPAGMIAAAGMLTKQLFNLGREFDETSAIIAKSTGATDAALKGLNQSLLNIGQAGVEQNFTEISAAVGELNTRFGLTGTTLEDTTRGFADFADVTGQNVAQSVKDVSQLLNKWNIDIKDSSLVLDKLTKAGQLSGISVSSLTNTLTQSAAQFQAVGFDIDKSLALLMSFEKSGVRTENAVTGLNKAISYFSERGIDAGQGLDALIESIQKADTESKALSISAEVFGMRAGVEMANAIRSGKFALDDYVAAMQSARGTVEQTDAASQTFGDRMDTLGNILKSRFAPIGTMITDIANGFLDFLIPALSTTTGNTEELSGLQADLTTNTNILKKSINDYAEANKLLNDNTITLNATERQTLENRKTLSGLQIAATLKDTIKTLNDMEKATKKGGENIEDFQANIKRYNNEISANAIELKKWRDLQAQGITNLGGEGVATQIKWANVAIETSTKGLQNNQDALAKQKLALGDVNAKHKETVEYLAAAVHAGQIQLKLIENYDTALAKEIGIKTQALDRDEKAIEYANKLAQGLLKESDLTQINDKALKDLILTKYKNMQLIDSQTEKQKALDVIASAGSKASEDAAKKEAERIKINEENTKALIENKIELIEYERSAELEAAESTGADRMLINAKYDKMIANEREAIEERYAMEILPTKLDRIIAQKEKELAEAKDAGANTVILEKYYNGLILEETERLAKEEEEINRKKNEQKATDNAKYVLDDIEQMRARMDQEIANASASGEDSTGIAAYWMAKINEESQNRTNEKIKIIADGNRQIEADTAATSSKIITNITTIIDGLGELVGRFDSEVGSMINNVVQLGEGIAKLVASEGADVAAWVQTIIAGIDLIIAGLESLSEWWDVNINKMGKMEEYAKYKFSEMQETFEQNIGDAFSNAFEEGISVEDLKKIIGKKILKVAVEAAMFAAGIEDKLKEIGDMVGSAIEDGFSEAELEQINKKVEEVYNTTNEILAPLAENIDKQFDIMETETEKGLREAQEAIKEAEEKMIQQQQEFASSFGNTFVSAFTEGFDLTELRTRIGEQLLQVAVESALMTIGFQEKMEALGALVADAINSGFTQQSLDAISNQVDMIYAQAATVIEPISALIGAKFGLNKSEEGAAETVAPETTEKKESGLVIQQNINIIATENSAMDVKRAAENGARDALYESWLTA